MTRRFTPKDARISAWKLRRELATCADPERVAQIERQLPVYDAWLRAHDPRDEFTPAEQQAEDADRGMYA